MVYLPSQQSQLGLGYPNWSGESISQRPRYFCSSLGGARCRRTQWGGSEYVDPGGGLIWFDGFWDVLGWRQPGFWTQFGVVMCPLLSVAISCFSCFRIPISGCLQPHHLLVMSRLIMIALKHPWSNAISSRLDRNHYCQYQSITMHFFHRTWFSLIFPGGDIILDLQFLGPFGTSFGPGT